MTPSDLPIYLIREKLLSILADHPAVVLSAPTGSGKSTQVPQFLLNAVEGKIIVLQPRRIAARLLAQRVSAELNTPLGDLVGFQTRHESKVSSSTRILFITEGLFLRQLRSDPQLKGVGAVILDEFHERNLASDVSLALVKRLIESGAGAPAGRKPNCTTNVPQSARAPAALSPLKLIVMSATLDVQLISQYLNCPSLETHGRLFPVDISYKAAQSTAGNKSAIGKMDYRNAAPIWNVAADTLSELLQRDPDGDVLIFMPGVYEIRKTLEACGNLPIDVFPLYSELPAHEQDLALNPSKTRKAIASTNVAETSITIPGIRHVIDAGQARVNRFDPKRGVNVLEIEPISKASADQRAGRAGRTAPGTCTRLWTQADHRHRAASADPEIRRLDLAESMLQLMDMGIENPRDFDWLEKPDPVAVDHAFELLEELGAIEKGRLTKVGEMMAELPMHPRLSRMLVEASQLGCPNRAALFAAFISERDILLSGKSCPFAKDLLELSPRSDFMVLERAFEYAKNARFDPQTCLAKGIHALACREVDRVHRQFVGGNPPRDKNPSLENLARCLLVGFADHLSLRKNPEHPSAFVIHGRRGDLDPDSISRHVGLLLPVEISEIGRRGESKTILSLVTEILPQWVEKLFKKQLRTETVCEFNPKTQAVEAQELRLLDDIPIERSLLPDGAVDRAVASSLLAKAIEEKLLKLDSWDESVDQWIARARCVASWFPERGLIQYDPTELGVILEEFCAGAIRAKDIRDKSILGALKDALSWEDRDFIDRMAPDRIALPRGWKMKVEYGANQQPRGRAKIQDFYGLNQTPMVAGGRVKVLLEILAPNMRPIQTTEDLAGFWQRLYPEIKKELSRRYPRHEWR